MENEECDRTHGEEPSFLDFLAAAPDLSVLEIERSMVPVSPVDPLDD